LNLARFFSSRPSLSRLGLIAASALWVSLLPNLGALRQFFTAPAAGEGVSKLSFVAGGWVTLFTVTFIAFMAVGALFRGQTLRWFCAIALACSSALGYFTWSVGMRFDRTMFANLIQTDRAEAAELTTPSLIAWVVLFGILPAVIALRTRVQTKVSWKRGFGRGGLAIVACVAATALFVFPQYQRYAAAARSKAISLESVAPVNFVGAAIGHGYAMRKVSLVRTPLGEDARVKRAAAKPRLVVFVLGETARAQNHSLNGYARETNPRLKTLDIAYFPNSEACGTSTTLAVPCIFSGFTRENFSMFKAMERQTLVDVVKRAGVSALWRENDGGCKDVCSGAEFEDFDAVMLHSLCHAQGSCYDELMLLGLEDKLRARSGDVFLVLHIKGSHGPAYYKRYPKPFERFTPACQTAELQQCTPEGLMNAYDNTIVYTDHILAETIAILNRLSDQFSTAMMYASDHGESLGENGLYLHGLPYAIAPDVQTKVPMLAWFSPQFLAMQNWHADCKARIAGKPSSHDAIFSSLLSLLAIETKEYKAELDLFRPCDASLPAK
jgi:lipid A ethanolaminephosphotransferase